MGWKSTLDVTREYALDAIMTRLCNLSDDALADVLETVLDDTEEGHGYNYMIKSAEDCNKDR